MSVTNLPATGAEQDADAAGTGWLLRQVMAGKQQTGQLGKVPSRVVRKEDTPACELNGVFFPVRPREFDELGIRIHDLRAILMQALLQRSGQTGAGLSETLRLSSRLLESTIRDLREERLLEVKKTAGCADYEYALTDLGLGQARRDWEVSSYSEVVPVSFRDYARSVEMQAPSRAQLTLQSLKRAMSDLRVADQLLSRIGRAVTGGRAMFLYGPPGNGKTSIAERIVRAYTDTIWIPYAVSFGGEIVRIYDPLVHEIVKDDSPSPVPHDERWLQIRRPAVIAGGELNLDATFFRREARNHQLQSPLHLKSNCGALIIDDFGRQRVRPDELLNRWIVPLESRVDFLPLPSGRSFRVPFEQLLVLSTNLQPSELVDEAYLRRIPYKIDVRGPSPEEFRQEFELAAHRFGFELADDQILDRIIDRHFLRMNRPPRFCHARDLLVLAMHHCDFHKLPRVLTDELVEEAVETYFFNVPG